MSARSTQGPGKGWRRSESTAVLLRPGAAAAASAVAPTRPRPPVDPRAGQTGLSWAVYVRNSRRRTQRRADGTVHSIGISLAEQERDGRAAVARFDSLPESITVFSDEGRSGGGGRSRAARDRLREAVARGEIDAVVAYNAKRIGRNLTESSQLWDHCVAHGAWVTTLDYPDLSNAMVRGAIFGGAEEEYKERQRYGLAMAAARRRNGLVGARAGCAYGLRWAGEVIEVVEREWPNVLLVYELYDDGWSMTRIARHLTSVGAPRRNVAHCEWNTSAVSHMLHSDWYAGRVPDGFESDGSRRIWTAPNGPFLDADLHARVRLKVGRHKRLPRKYDHAMSGLLFCGECRGWSPMSLAWSRKPRKDGTALDRERYRCIHRVRAPASCPTGMSIDARETERVLLGLMRERLGESPLARERFIRRRGQEIDRVHEEVSGCDERVLLAEAAQDELWARRQNGERIPDRIFNREMERCDRVISESRARRQALTEGTVLDAASLTRLRDELPGGELSEEIWFSFVPSRRGEFLRLLFPHGVFVSARLPGHRRGDVTGRIGERTQNDVVSAESVRTGRALRTRSHGGDT